MRKGWNVAGSGRYEYVLTSFPGQGASIALLTFHYLLDAWYLTHLNPYAAIEEQGAWQARAKSGEVFVFERAIIVDRRAYHQLFLFCVCDTRQLTVERMML
jgi:hypothetical protein